MVNVDLKKIIFAVKKLFTPYLVFQGKDWITIGSGPFIGRGGGRGSWLPGSQPFRSLADYPPSPLTLLK